MTMQVLSTISLLLAVLSRQRKILLLIILSLQVVAVEALAWAVVEERAVIEQELEILLLQILVTQ
jgi:hypothetical protein